MRQHARWAAVLAVGVLSTAGATAAQTPARPASVAVPGPDGRPRAALRAEPVPPAVDAAFKAWDADDDGALSLAEFRNGWRNLRRGSRQTAGAGLQRQFDRLDANDNGGIDRTEYSDLVLVKRAGALAPPFSQVDGNNDQKLDFAEYSGVVRQLRSTRPGKASPDK